MIRFANKVCRIIHKVIFVQRFPILRARRHIDKDAAFLLAFVISDGQAVIKVQSVGQRLKENISRTDEDILSGLPEWILLFWNLADIFISI